MPAYTEVTNEVLDLAQSLIRQYHPDLLDARLGFVFQDKAGLSGGFLIYAQTSKVSPAFQAAGLELDFLVKIAFDIWCGFTSDQRAALIDHQLCHCKYEADATSLLGHDIEEFKVIIDRYGLWNHNLLLAGNSLHKASQLSFAFEEARELKKMGTVVAVDPAKVPVQE